jgi:uncharacterized protein YjiS (DUF1127 family)
MELRGKLAAPSLVERTFERGGAASGPLGLFRQAVRVLGLWRNRSRARRELRELCAMDDRVLKDIGLTRGEVIFEASKPFWL